MAVRQRVAEIEITPEMIEAGLNVLDEELLEGSVIEAFRGHLCRAVFEAMYRAAREQSERLESGS